MTNLERLAEIVDRAHQDALRRLGRLPLNDEDFRRLVAEGVFRRLREWHATDFLPGLAA
jgi:hypothetical protein